MGYGQVGLEEVGMHGEDSRCCRTSNSNWGQSDGWCRHGLATWLAGVGVGGIVQGLLTTQGELGIVLWGIGIVLANLDMSVLSM